MASNSGLLFLNKAIQSEDFNVFAKYGIREESFVSAADRRTYRFIEDYYEKNGQMPSYAMVADSVQDFTYIPDITDRFEPLADGIHNRKLTVEFNEFFTNDFEDIKREANGDSSEVIEKLTESLTSLRMKHTNTRSVGTDMKTGTEKFMSEYEKRKAGESHTTWKSFMSYVNTEITGYTSGNMYVFFGQSGRGKSVIVLREALEMAQQGARVLLWSLEMPTYEVLSRIYTMLSAKLGKTTLTIDGQRREAGFDSADIRGGSMAEEHEASLEEMLSEINEHIEGTIIVRAVDDHDFQRRDVAQLKTDIEATNADVAIVDPMYYMNFEKNTSKTAGGDASETSKKLRRLAGTQDVVLMAITQADEGDKEDKPGEVRELKLQSRGSVKKTKSLLEDASTLISVDTDYTASRGVVGILKGRNGGEGTSCEITFIPRYGIVEELSIDGDMFDF